MIIHPIPPLYDKNSQILILGSFPSPKSREAGFFYGHPQNLFWPLLAEILGQEDPQQTTAARREFALKNRIAMWDVLAACEIKGADDNSIEQARANDLSPILSACPIRAIFTTGKAAKKYYDLLTFPQTGREAIYLPSTSPANRAMHKKPEFWAAWRQVAEYLRED
ncbi:MAG: DNA-deoxyinosine glycosylase [Clostridia bacterium]|nr:DNA-deoxyinosine glycosylase [Clostridia bacterium]